MCTVQMTSSSYFLRLNTMTEILIFQIFVLYGAHWTVKSKTFALKFVKASSIMIERLCIWKKMNENEDIQWEKFLISLS